MWPRIRGAMVPPAVLWLAYLAFVVVLLAPLGREVVLFDSRYFGLYASSFAMFLVVMLSRTFWVDIVARGDVPLGQRLRDIVRGKRWFEMTFLGVVPALLFVFTLMNLFKSFKPTIPDHQPFVWDEIFRDWDRVLFLGYDGWEITHWLVPWDRATVMIDTIYVIWFPAVLITVFIAAISPLSSRIRLAYFLTFALNWIVGGSILAIAFSSAGPVFYDRVLGDDTFVPMILRLVEASQSSMLATVTGIELLWDGHLGLPDVPQYGISAFPSLHVAMSALVWVYVRQLSRFWGWLTCVFLGVIVFGSVHLGWHYLVDGIAGLALTLVHWWLAMRFARWWLGPEATRGA